jgi:hypothetical protein
MDVVFPRLLNRAFAMDKLSLTPLAKLRVPLGGQEIELQQVDYAVGGMSLLRLRIREGKRFTVFDVDPVTARAWGEEMIRWAQGQPDAGESLIPVDET